MAELTLLVPGPAPAAHRKVTITTSDGSLSWTVPLLKSIGLDNLASRWAISDRPGRLPITSPAGKSAATATLVVKVGNDITVSVERDLQFAQNFAAGDRPVVVAAGQLNRWSGTGTWIVTGMSIDPGSVLLVQGTNEIAVCELTITLTAALTPTQVRSTLL